LAATAAALEVATLTEAAAATLPAKAARTSATAPTLSKSAAEAASTAALHHVEQLRLAANLIHVAARRERSAATLALTGRRG
jgi:hypothetical protein